MWSPEMFYHFGFITFFFLANIFRATEIACFKNNMYGIKV